MAKSKIQKLRNRFTLFINREKDIDPNRLLTDLVDYQKQELKRGFADLSVQSESIHTRLIDELESI